MAVAFQNIREAAGRIGGQVVSSPCPLSIPLSEATGMRIFCKLEYLQRTGSFKERGARNALLLLSPEQQKRGVIAASAGNHALGLSYHGQLLGIPVTVVMPRFAPLMKVANCRRLGAEVILHGSDIGEARGRADELAAEKNLPTSMASTIRPSSPAKEPLGWKSPNKFPMLTRSSSRLAVRA
jgi:threonine dehydratase